MTCRLCEMLRINGVPTHEIGCPEAWRTKTRECKECGQKFIPKTRGQVCCSEECCAAYYGLATV